MNAETRELVWSRAGDRCEYCRIHQDDEPFYRLHIEHVKAEMTRPALPTRIEKTHQLARLWVNSGEIRAFVVVIVMAGQSKVVRFVAAPMLFGDDGPLIVGRTQCGRATVAVLALNERDRVELRAELIA